mmetsp:Transcript_2795/g.7126  ORF Transcript_2795/g.7126 Transcript_2795/m.7126 type:complete len:334 (-) Transcript_2795:389-1390(-)
MVSLRKAICARIGFSVSAIVSSVATLASNVAQTASSASTCLAQSLGASTVPLPDGTSRGVSSPMRSVMLAKPSRRTSDRFFSASSAMRKRALSCSAASKALRRTRSSSPPPAAPFHIASCRVRTCSSFVSKVVCSCSNCCTRARLRWKASCSAQLLSVSACVGELIAECSFIVAGDRSAPPIDVVAWMVVVVVVVFTCKAVAPSVAIPTFNARKISARALRRRTLSSSSPGRGVGKLDTNVNASSSISPADVSRESAKRLMRSAIQRHQRGSAVVSLSAMISTFFTNSTSSVSRAVWYVDVTPPSPKMSDEGYGTGRAEADVRAQLALRRMVA